MLKKARKLLQKNANRSGVERKAGAAINYNIQRPTHVGLLHGGRLSAAHKTIAKPLFYLVVSCAACGFLPCLDRKLAVRWDFFAALSCYCNARVLHGLIIALK